MGIRHMNKALALPLPTREKFVLVTLGRYAKNENDTCFPGIKKIAEITGFCEKTVQRSLKILSTLEIIDIESTTAGNNNYTLYLTGDFKSWEMYLNSKAEVFGGNKKVKQSQLKDSKSSYNNTYNKEEDVIDKEVWVAGELSPAVKKIKKKESLKEIDIYNSIPPGKRLHIMEKVWITTINKSYKGKIGKITSLDKWHIDDIYKKCENVVPVKPDACE